MSRSAPAKNVNEYLKAFPPPMKTVLKQLRETIKATAPQAEEVISYGIPGYKYHGRLVYFAGFQNHCSLFPASQTIFKIFAKELKPYYQSKGTIRFTVEDPIPATLVKKIVKIRIKENEDRTAAKKLRGKGKKK